MTNETRVATKARLENFLAHLVDQLDACGFLRNQPKRPGMVRNIRHFFERGEVHRAGAAHTARDRNGAGAGAPAVGAGGRLAACAGTVW